ncbi:MAG: radical SAM protein, partial [Candidatus Sericytochromatia bacterium]|nr:radical SAM protein [Candidatus Sericytochromatia bacterium]
MLKKDEQIFLDDYSIADVEKALKIKIRVSEMGADNFIKSCLGVESI